MVFAVREMTELASEWATPGGIFLVSSQLLGNQKVNGPIGRKLAGKWFHACFWWQKTTKPFIYATDAFIQYFSLSVGIGIGNKQFVLKDFTLEWRPAEVAVRKGVLSVVATAHIFGGDEWHANSAAGESHFYQKGT